VGNERNGKDFHPSAWAKRPRCTCPNAPKPRVLMYVLADEELLFFELPLMTSYKPKMENSRAGRVTVT
jgi:hypothetical protein